MPHWGVAVLLYAKEARMTTALGVSVDENDNGVTPLTHRMIIGSFFQNKGVVDGLKVTGRSDLKYAVAAGVAVCSRAASDGKMLAYWPGGTTEEAVNAGDPSNPRVDVIWIRANNKPEYVSDADNQVHVGVTMGVASANPVKPVIPADATEICCMHMPAGATSTQSATLYWTVNYSIPFGSTMGKLAENWDKRDSKWAADTGKIVDEQKVTFTIPTDRLLRFEFKCNFSQQQFKQGSAEWAMSFKVDGSFLDHSASNFVSTGTAWETHETSYVTALTAGTHTACISGWHVSYEKPWFHWNGKPGTNEAWIGRRFMIWDLGVAQ